MKQAAASTGYKELSSWWNDWCLSSYDPDIEGSGSGAGHGKASLEKNGKNKRKSDDNDDSIHRLDTQTVDKVMELLCPPPADDDGSPPRRLSTSGHCRQLTSMLLEAVARSEEIRKDYQAHEEYTSAFGEENYELKGQLEDKEAEAAEALEARDTKTAELESDNQNLSAALAKAEEKLKAYEEKLSSLKGTKSKEHVMMSLQEEDRGCASPIYA